MPAPVQDAEVTDAGSPLQRKSNAWPTEERDDIYNRRQEGEKWDTICLDYPHRSKHAMQQQYSNTPTKGRGRRKGIPPTLISPTAMNGKKGSKRRISPEDADQSDVDADDESAASAPSKSVGGYDGAPETDNDSENPKEPDSARKQRLRRRLQQTSGNEDEDEQPVPTRPKRKRASGVNYNLLQNSGFDLEDQADNPADESIQPHVPLRKSKIIALKMGIPKTPVDDRARKPSRSINIDGVDESMLEDSSNRRSQRVKKVVNGKRGSRASPATNVAEQETSVRGGKRKRRSLFPQDLEPDPSVEGDSDVMTTRLSKKRKDSEAQSTESRTQKAVESAPESEPQPSTKKKRQGKPKEHLGFLPNGLPRQRRRRRTRAEMEAAERKTSTPATTSTSRRRSRYQFPFLEGYSGPAPPDMAAILARQEHERQNSRPEPDSEPESAFSSLQSLDDEDDAMDVQTQAVTATTVDEEVSPMTRPNMDDQIPAAVVEQSSPVEATGSSADLADLDIPDVVFYPEDLERARESARKLRALNNEYKTASTNKVTAAEINLENEKRRTQDLSQELQDLRKVHDGCESKAKDAKAVAQQLKGLKEISSLYDEALEKLTASERTVAEEKSRSGELEEELSGTRTQSILREKSLEGQVAELTKKLASDKRASGSEDIIKRQLDLANRLLTDSNAEKSALTAQHNRLLSNKTALEEAFGKRQKELELENSNLNKKLADITKEHESLLNERNTKKTNDPISTKDGATDRPPTPAPTENKKTSLPSPAAAFFDLISGRSSPTPSTVPITTIKPHLEQLRKTHISIGYNLRVSSESHTTHDGALNTLHEKLEDGDISMNKVRERVKELVAGSLK
ncbi:MAG: hypothetical protein Q9192_006912, partial [Flavoplaca navasiana]